MDALRTIYFIKDILDNYKYPVHFMWNKINFEIVIYMGNITTAVIRGRTQINQDVDVQMKTFSIRAFASFMYVPVSP